MGLTVADSNPETLKGLGDPTGPALPPPELRVLPIRVPRWMLRPCTRLEMRRHSYGRTERRLQLGILKAGGKR